MKSKKAQHSQIFTIILGIVIVGGILLFGYSSFNKLRIQSEQAEFIQFKEDLKSGVNLVYSDYGTVKKKELRLPLDYDEICFVDVDYVWGEIATTENYNFIQNNKVSQNNRGLLTLIDDSVKSNVKKNTFLLGPKNAFDSILLGNEDTEKSYIKNSNTPFVCVKASNGYLTLRLEGLGNGVKIEEW